MGRASHGVWFAAMLAACGGGGGPATVDSGMAEVPAATQHIVAFEGQRAFVESLTVEGVDLTGATLEVEPRSGLTLRDSLCNARRCGAVLTVEDTEPNRGVAIPAPIDAHNSFIVVVDSAGGRHRGLVSVNPLDTITGAGSTPLTIGNTVMMAASADMASGSTFRGPEGGQPLRWIIFGDASLHGTLDLTAGPDLPAAAAGRRASGFAGGGPSSPGQGPSGGAAGETGAGAGGGGAAGAGTAGDGVDGSAGTGGVGGVAGDSAQLACLADFSRGDCGGSGGGGSVEGQGGNGGGAALIVSLGRLDLDGATVVASGTDGVDGGGGGGGGALFLAGEVVTGTFDVNIDAGSGGAATATVQAGGPGGAGSVRIDGGDGGLAFELSGLSYLVSGTTITLTGVGVPGATLEIGAVGGGNRAISTVTPEGTFSVEVPLEPGLNRLTLTDTTDAPIRSFSGNSVELQRLAGPQALPVGGVLDLVSLPPDE